MKNEIIEFLENNELRKEVIENVQSLWSFAGTFYDNPDEDMQKYLKENKEASLWEEAWWRAEIHGHIDKIEKAFDKYIIQKMPKPYRLTLEELVTAFLDLVKPHEKHIYEFEQFSSADCDNLYMVFVNHVMNHILSYRYSAPFPICRITVKEEDELLLEGFLLGYSVATAHTQGNETQPRDLGVKSTREEAIIWDKNSISVRLLRGADVIEEKPGGKKLCHLLAVIEGQMSISSCSMLQDEMSRILPTAIRSADLLHAEGFGGDYKVIDVIEPKIPLLYEREIAGLPWGNDELIETAKPLIKQYLDAYYSESSKKDSIDRRIRNAVYLLIESDNQPNNAVGLAMAITSIEALLGENVEGLTAMLAERVSTLLEPDDTQRNNATEFVKKLYNTRSRTLHGELVETENEARISARHLAAAVLDAMIFLKLAAPSYYNVRDTPDNLRKFLYDSRRTPGQPLGIKEYNVCNLWRNKTSG